MPKKPIVVYEHSRLNIGDQDFDESHYIALVKYNDLHGSKYFDVGHRKITFKSYVGVIQAGSRVIAVLPKADNDPRDGADTQRKWQGALLYMLRKSGYIRLNETEKASQDTSNTNLMDIYLFTFLKQVEVLIHAGLVKKYRRKRDNQMALKGRLLIEKQIQYNTIHKERFFTEHTIYDRDNVFNRILKTALEIIQDTTTNSTIKQDAAKQLLYFDGITQWFGKATDFDNIKLDRKTQPYKYALELARMIILNYCPDMRSGTKPVLALLFDMNLLFEKFIYRMLKEEEQNFKSDELIISRQSSQFFWAHKTIRPDIIIDCVERRVDKTNNETKVPHRIIVDTKWKIVPSGSPSDIDLKQMYAYNMQFNAEHSILLYPFVDQKNSRGEYSPSIRRFNFTHSCEMCFIELFEEGRISALFGSNFLKYVLKTSKISGPIPS